MPGTPIPGAMLPVNWDVFTDITIVLANSPILVNTLGNLLPDGTESANLVVGPGVMPPAAVGLRFFFAYPAVAGPPWFASTPECVVVVN
jgi:hypothetical protein